MFVDLMMVNVSYDVFLEVEFQGVFNSFIFNSVYLLVNISLSYDGDFGVALHFFNLFENACGRDGFWW